MVGWSELFGFEMVLARISGFVLFSPILGRSNIPGYAKTGLILVLSVFVYGLRQPMPAPPGTVVELVVRLGVELIVGFVLGFLMQLCAAIVQAGGEIIDAQMGLTMAQIYDASSQANMSVTASLLNILFFLNFFAVNGHYTLMRILLGSAEILPFGTAVLGEAAASYVAEVFFSSMLLAVKMALPILAAEELGMGILLKAIPQINAFVINMELKVIIGLILLFLFLTPLSEFLLGAEADMLSGLRRGLAVMAGSG